MQILREALEGVTDLAVEFAEGGGWSVKENLAHLVVGEEWNTLTLAQFLDVQHRGRCGMLQETDHESVKLRLRRHLVRHLLRRFAHPLNVFIER